MKKTINIQAFIIGCFITLFISSAFGAESTKDTLITTNLNQPHVEAFSTPDPSITSSRGCLPSIKKYTKSNFFVYGETGRYGIKIENKGRGTCYGVKFVDTLPQGMSLSQESVFKGWDCKVSKAIFPAVVTLTCHYKLPLLPNATAHMGFNVNIPSLEDAGGVGWGKMSVTNCAKAFGAGIAAYEPPAQPITNSCIKTEVQENKRPFKLKVRMPRWEPDGSGDGGGSNVLYFNIPTNPSEYSYNYNVDCNSDGAYEATGVAGDYTCEYRTEGDYIISISGRFPHLFFRNILYQYTNTGILSVEQWGDIEWRSMRQAFKNARSLSINALDVPDLTRVTDMSNMFKRGSVRQPPDDGLIQRMEAWDVSNVTNMSGMFYQTTTNQSLEGWDVSNVISMSGMFFESWAFNQPLEGWDVSNVTNMAYMFSGAEDFNQPLEGWDVSNVINMKGMFSKPINVEEWEYTGGDSSFDQPLEGWDVSNVTNMAYMFRRAVNFNQPLEGWDVSNVTDMSGMFRLAVDFNQPLEGWDVSNVTRMAHMFSIIPRVLDWGDYWMDYWEHLGHLGASSFNQPLERWDVSNVTDMYAMFGNAGKFNQPLERWDVSNVTNMRDMFRQASDFNQSLEAWNVSIVERMDGMFWNAESFASNDLSVWDVSNVVYYDDFLTGAGSGNIEPIWN